MKILNDNLEQDEKNVQKMTSEIQEVENKLTELKLILSENLYQVVCITESNLNDDIFKAEIEIQ